MPAHPHQPFLERLAERLERRGTELGQLVEKEDSPVRERELSRPDAPAAPATDERDRRGAVMWRAERPFAHQDAGGCEPGDGVDARDLEGVAGLERGEDRREPPGEHGLPDARRPDEEQVVRSRGGDRERPSRAGQPAHFTEVGGVGIGWRGLREVREGRARVPRL